GGELERSARLPSRVGERRPRLGDGEGRRGAPVGVTPRVPLRPARADALVVTPVALPTPGPGVREPPAAIDPANPSRMAVAAMMYGEGDDVTRSVYAWQSEDAGGTWRGSRVELPVFDDEGAADPLVVYATDGTLLVVAMAMSRQLADAVMTAY